MMHDIWQVKTKLRSLFCLIFILGMLALWGWSTASADSLPPGKKTPPEQGISLDRFMADLKKRGFEVALGGLQLWAVEDCPQSFAVMGTCYFNNPAAPYVLAVVPYWPDEYVDPATQGAFGATDPGFGTSFRLDPNEAIVIFGFLRRRQPTLAYRATCSRARATTRRTTIRTVSSMISAPRASSSTGPE